MSLQQFLKDQAEQLRSAEVTRRLGEWVESVAHLVELLRTWLDEADPERILAIEPRCVTVREEGFLPYVAEGLEVGLGGRLVRVAPVARNVVGPLPKSGPFEGLRAQGRVDLVGDSGKFFLYRYPTDGGDRWAIVDEDRDRVRPLDRAAFEAAIQQLLA